MFIEVSPDFFKKLEIWLSSSIDFKSNVTSFMVCESKSFKEPIFWIFILLNRFSSLENDLTTVKIKELPSFKFSLFCSRISEKINNSKTLDKSVNFKTA